MLYIQPTSSILPALVYSTVLHRGVIWRTGTWLVAARGLFSQLKQHRFIHRCSNLSYIIDIQLGHLVVLFVGLHLSADMH